MGNGVPWHSLLTRVIVAKITDDYHNEWYKRSPPLYANLVGAIAQFKIIQAQQEPLS
jgi:hypothetical protein